MTEQQSDLYTQLFGKIGIASGEEVEHPQRETNHHPMALFYQSIDRLRDPAQFPNAAINNLMTLFWNMTGQEVTPAIISPTMKTVSFSAQYTQERARGAVLVPEKFDELCREHPITQLGALIFTASQVRDFYNRRSQDPVDLVERAQAFEAEFVMTMRHVLPEYQPNEYHRQVLTDYPHGLASLDAKLYYESLPFVKDIKKSWLMSMIFQSLAKR